MGKTILSTKTLPDEWSSLGRAKQDLRLTLQIHSEDRADAKAKKEKKAALKSKLKKAARIHSTFFRSRSKEMRKYS